MKNDLISIKGNVKCITESNRTCYYDLQGNMIKEIMYDESQNREYETATFKNEYDEEGYLIKVEVIGCDEFGSLNQEHTIEYEYLGGFVIEETHYDDNEDFHHKWTFVNDRQGNRIIATKYDEFENWEYELTFKYDDKGHKIEEVKRFYHPYKIRKITLTRTFKYKYNDKFALITIYGPQYTSFYRYEFDAIGNWIKLSQSENDNPDTITERIIEYY
ncbi:MAG: hypothetical protein WCI97_07250 [Bacteroidota bacterium]